MSSQFLDFVFMVVFAIGALSLVAIVKTVAKTLTARRFFGESPEHVAALEERAARLELTVEALTVDSDRLIADQRFLSQLLTEKNDASPSRAPG